MHVIAVPTTPQERTFHDYRYEETYKAGKPPILMANSFSFDVFAKCEEVLREHQNGRV